MNRKILLLLAVLAQSTYADGIDDPSFYEPEKHSPFSKQTHSGLFMTLEYPNECDTKKILSLVADDCLGGRRQHMPISRPDGVWHEPKPDHPQETVPEPTPVLFLGLALTFLGLFERTRK